jgi:hypothetical protein
MVLWDGMVLYQGGSYATDNTVLLPMAKLLTIASASTLSTQISLAIKFLRDQLEADSQTIR